jgi:hypothetical protein
MLLLFQPVIHEIAFLATFTKPAIAEEVTKLMWMQMGNASLLALSTD